MRRRRFRSTSTSTKQHAKVDNARHEHAKLERAKQKHAKLGRAKKEHNIWTKRTAPDMLHA